MPHRNGSCGSSAPAALALALRANYSDLVLMDHLEYAHINVHCGLWERFPAHSANQRSGGLR